MGLSRKEAIASCRPFKRPMWNEYFHIPGGKIDFNLAQEIVGIESGTALKSTVHNELAEDYELLPFEPVVFHGVWNDYSGFLAPTPDQTMYRALRLILGKKTKVTIEVLDDGE